jgi:TPR repeat protein
VNKPIIYFEEAVESGKLSGLSKAKKYLRLAYQGGNEYAAVPYAQLLVVGDTKGADKELGISILEKAVNGGQGEAAVTLYRFYKEGVHIDPDPKKAKYYYKLAMKMGLQIPDAPPYLEEEL